MDIGITQLHCQGMSCASLSFPFRPSPLLLVLDDRRTSSRAGHFYRLAWKFAITSRERRLDMVSIISSDHAAVERNLGASTLVKSSLKPTWCQQAPPGGQGASGPQTDPPVTTAHFQAMSGILAAWSFGASEDLEGQQRHSV